MSASQGPKRFIAGAICPSCGAEDKTLMYSSDDGVVRECIACKHTEVLDELGQPQELGTRVNRKPADDDAAVIRILDS